MIEQDGFEVDSFTVSTPPDCLKSYTTESDIVRERFLDKLYSLGVIEVSYYSEFNVTVKRNSEMTFDEQYQLVVEGLKKILNNLN